MNLVGNATTKRATGRHEVDDLTVGYVALACYSAVRAINVERRIANSTRVERHVEGHPHTHIAGNLAFVDGMHRDNL